MRTITDTSTPLVPDACRPPRLPARAASVLRCAGRHPAV